MSEQQKKIRVKIKKQNIFSRMTNWLISRHRHRVSGGVQTKNHAKITEEDLRPNPLFLYDYLPNLDSTQFKQLFNQNEGAASDSDEEEDPSPGDRKRKSAFKKAYTQDESWKELIETSTKRNCKKNAFLHQERTEKFTNKKVPLKSARSEALSFKRPTVASTVFKK